MAASVDTATSRSVRYASPREVPSQAVSSLEEERYEVLDSVLQSICATGSDPDRLAACAYLMRHLARTGSRT